MIPIKQGRVTHLVKPEMKLVDFLKQYGRMPVYRRSTARQGKDDKPASYQDIQNGKRRAAYAQRLEGVKPAYLQLWSAP